MIVKVTLEREEVDDLHRLLEVDWDNQARVYLRVDTRLNNISMGFKE